MTSINRDIDEAYWAVEQDRDNAQRWFTLGRTLLRRSRVSNVTVDPLDEPAARLALCVASNLQPADAELCFELGQLLEECGEVLVATHTFARAADLEPVWTEPCVSVARLLRNRSREQLAEVWAKRGLERAQQYGASPSLMTNLAETFGHLGHWNSALEILRSAYGPEPEDAPSLINLAIAGRLAGEIGAAARYARRAVELDPASPVGRLTLARCLETVGDFDEAATAYEAAVSLGPRLVDAQEGLTRVRAMKSSPAAFRIFASAAPTSKARDNGPDGCMRGDLSAFSVPELLEVIRIHRSSGQLILSRGQTRVIIGFRQGALVNGCNERESILRTDDGWPGPPGAQIARSPEEARTFFVELLTPVLEWKSGQFAFRRIRSSVPPSNLAQDSKTLLSSISNGEMPRRSA